MTGTRAALYWACFLTMALYYALAVGPAPPVSPAAARAPFLELDAAGVTSVVVKREGRVVRCERAGDRWQATQPAGAAVASDLVASLVGVLGESPDVEVVDEGERDRGDFGLEPARTTITLERRDLPAVSVYLGVANPADTAVYAARDDGKRVFLIGLNVRYYADLVLAGAFPSP